MRLLYSLTLLSVMMMSQQTTQGQELPHYAQSMQMNCGFITEKIAETKTWYQEVLHFKVIFENEFYLLMSTPNDQAQISFLLPDHPSQKTIFQPRFAGVGAYITLTVNDVDALYEDVQAKGIPIEIALRDEPWGDRHFAVVDPNGIGVDLVTYSAPEN